MLLHADSEDSNQPWDLSLRWAHKSFYWFCYAAAHIMSFILQTEFNLVILVLSLNFPSYQLLYFCNDWNTTLH